MVQTSLELGFSFCSTKLFTSVLNLGTRKCNHIGFSFMVGTCKSSPSVEDFVSIWSSRPINYKIEPRLINPALAWKPFQKPKNILVPSKHYTYHVLRFNESFESKFNMSWVKHSYVKPHVCRVGPQWKMNGKWLGNTFLLGFISLTNHG